MSGDSAVTKVLDALAERGFRYIGRSDTGWAKAQGVLRLPGAAASHQCIIELDPVFFAPPRIRLTDLPSGLPAVLPHVSSGGWLCYLNGRQVSLDQFDPVGQTLACILRAEQVLESVLSGEMVDDLEEEFHAYWGESICFADLKSEETGKVEAITMKLNDRTYWCATDDVPRTNAKLEPCGMRVQEQVVPVYRVKTSAAPRPMREAWPPRTVGQLLSWQSHLDGACRRKISQRLNEGMLSKKPGSVVLVESPSLTYAFAVLFSRTTEGSPARRVAKSQRALLQSKVIPLTVFRLDERYVAERNIPGKRTLRDLRICLVGCGTIGGYLAELLVKAGAGSGRGELTLVDCEILLPQNLGRHQLGFSSLLHPKAEALSDSLQRLMPDAHVRAVPVDVREAQISSTDLIVDATGEDTVGHWLTNAQPRGTPILSIWIEGPGTAVRGIMRDTESAACSRCLWEYNRTGQYPAVSEDLPISWAGQGCEDLYVPFPASVSLQAAGLGADMALDWVNGRTSPRLRTRIVEPSYSSATEDADLGVHPHCPACT
nr:ThiF family adenylyltransferase [Oceanococcus sp. HetDA_MAG_MS8]